MDRFFLYIQFLLLHSLISYLNILNTVWSISYLGSKYVASGTSLFQTPELRIRIFKGKKAAYFPLPHTPCQKVFTASSELRTTGPQMLVPIKPERASVSGRDPQLAVHGVTSWDSGLWRDGHITSGSIFMVSVKDVNVLWIRWNGYTPSRHQGRKATHPTAVSSDCLSKEKPQPHPHTPH